MVGKGVANALAFARFVTVAALPDYSDGQDLDPRVIKLIAVNIVSVVCLIHYFSTDLGRLLNRVTAAYKLVLLVVVFGSGYWAAQVQHVGLGREDDQPPNPDATSRLGAFVLVLYSYSGWENANYVS
jgi:amino acid transporter